MLGDRCELGDRERALPVQASDERCPRDERRLAQLELRHASRLHGGDDRGGDVRGGGVLHTEDSSAHMDTLQGSTREIFVAISGSGRTRESPAASQREKTSGRPLELRARPTRVEHHDALVRYPQSGMAQMRSVGDDQSQLGQLLYPIHEAVNDAHNGRSRTVTQVGSSEDEVNREPITLAVVVLLAFAAGCGGGSPSKPATTPSGVGYADCVEAMTPLLTKLENVDARLDVGMVQADYGNAVGAVAVAYSRIDFDSLAHRTA